MLLALYMPLHNVYGQTKKVWLDVYRGGERTMVIDTQEIDSIVFREAEEVSPELQWRRAMSFFPKITQSGYNTRAASVAMGGANVDEFAVSAKKNDGQYLFENYLCVKRTDEINKTETNTGGWEYVFGNQTTQYWTEANSACTFQAVAFKQGNHPDVTMHDGVAEMIVKAEDVGKVYATGNQKASCSQFAISLSSKPASAVALEFSPLAAKVELEIVAGEGFPSGYTPLLSFSDANGNKCKNPVFVGSVASEGYVKIDWNNSTKSFVPRSYADCMELDGEWDSYGAFKKASAYVIPGQYNDLELSMVADDNMYILRLPKELATWESGKLYKICVTLTKVSLSVNLVVSPLDEESNENIVLE